MLIDPSVRATTVSVATKNDSKAPTAEWLGQL